MKFHSILQQSPSVTFRDAIFSGLAPDGSLYIPEYIPVFSKKIIDNLPQYSLREIGIEVAKLFIDDIPLNVIETIFRRTFSFPIPLRQVYENIFLLELFHGPTLAFKDVGARFLAETLSFFLQQEQKSLSIIVATSGDTGSAVAHGFFKVPNIDVFILYPSKKISTLQEQQMTTLGNNIYAIEVQGTFDDCQRIVKQTLNDKQILQKKNITTANSINIGRLIPQIVYYIWGIAQLRNNFSRTEPVYVVPSGNFGNITAGVYAHKMGTPVQHFVAATNVNDVVRQYFSSGVLTPAASVQTISNAMDVGNPSNFVRVQSAFEYDLKKIRKEISCYAVTDEETLLEIRNMYHHTAQIIDPHTAVGVHAAIHYSAQLKNNIPMIVTATAHHGKFPEVTEQALQQKFPEPPQLVDAQKKKKQSMLIAANYDLWKKLFLAL